jgi:hypothetical protein
MPLVAPCPLHRTHIFRLLLKFYILRRTPTLPSSVLVLSGFRARTLLSDTSSLSECPFHSELDNLHFMLQIAYLRCFHIQIPQV